jgi:hypothetical protein
MKVQNSNRDLSEHEKTETTERSQALCPVMNEDPPHEQRIQCSSCEGRVMTRL